MALRPALRYPGAALGEDGFVPAFETFSRVARAIAGDGLGDLVQAVCDRPDDPQALYDLGYQLIEQGLPEVAATALARGHRLRPEAPGLLSELVAALESDLAYPEAVRLLEAASEVVERDFVCRYLLAFNAVMTGDLDRPRQLLPSLRAGEPENLRGMAARIEGLLARADALATVTALDGEDLRGWHAVLTGALLTHISPHGFDEGMRGRYAFTQDSPGRCREGLARLAAALQAADRQPSRVRWLHDAASESLGRAAATVLDLPGEPLSLEDRGAAPTLVVAYDLSEADPRMVVPLAAHAPGEVLFAQATHWLREQVLVADVTTYLYQHNNSPWDPGLGYDKDADRPVERPADPRPPEARAADVAAAEPDPIDPADLATCATLLEAAAGLPPEHRLGLGRDAGRRHRLFLGGPVGSNRFV